MNKIYIIKCIKNKYYIINVNNLNEIENIFTNNFNNKFIKKYNPLKIIDIIENIEDKEDLVDEYVNIYMTKYGIDNVRGGIYNQLFLDKIQIININNKIKFLPIVEEIEETYNKSNWLIEEDRYLYENFIKTNNGYYYIFINENKRSYNSIIRRINNLKDVEHVNYKRLHNNNLEKIYKCKCTSNFVFENEKKYNNHLTNKIHIIYEKNEEIKELKILLTRKDNNICSLNIKIHNLFDNTKLHLKEIEKLEQKILLIKENTNNNNINILENIYNQTILIGVDKTSINILSIIILMIITI